MAAYRSSYDDGDVCAVPEPNSRFWTKPIRIHSTQGAADSSTVSEEAMWASLEDEDAAARVQLAARLDALNL